jgi:hypothetical protein
MKQVERDTGRPLIWAAVNHHNTDNPHVHIVIRGIDRDGDEVRIDGPYISREMRWRAQEIVTRELGPRSELESSRTLNAEIDRERFTEIDRGLAGIATPDGLVMLQDVLAQPRPEGRVGVARLQVLEQLNLARVERPGVWRLAEVWKERLERLGEFHDVIDRLRPIVGDEAIRFQRVDVRNPVPSFEGVVVGKGLDDELSGRMFAAIRTPAGDGFYVRMAPDVAESLREGETVRVGFDVERWLKPADRIVVRFAQENGGIYDPVRHQQELENLPRTRQDTGGPTPARRVEANIRRLERLARYQLAARLPDGRWQIPADLVTQLEARESSHPQHRLRVERASAPGRSLERERTLDAAKERKALGQALAKQLGLTYVSDPPKFQGRLFDCAPTPSGHEYSRIADYPRGQFTLVPKPPGAERLLGRTVTVERDQEQRLVIRRGPETSR